MMVPNRRDTLKLGLGFGAALTSGAASLAAAEDFFHGKTVRLLVAAQPGGSYDLTARILSEFIGNYIPGKPTFVVQNMVGAGGLTMTNYLYNAAPKDGTVCGLPLNSVFLEPSLRLLSREGGQANFDLSKIN